MISFPQIDIPPRLRRPLMLAAYPAFALFVLVVTIVASAPRDRIKDRLETEMSADVWSGRPLATGMDVSIGDLSLTLLTGPGVVMKDIVLRTRPTNPEVKPIRHIIDSLAIKAGVFGPLIGRPSVSFKAELLSGSIAGTTRVKSDETSTHVELRNIVLTNAASIQQAAGIPIEGTGQVTLDIVAPKHLLAGASGSFDITVEDVVIGDGKSKLTIPGDPFLSSGITFPKVRLGKLTGHIAIDKGKAKFEGVRVSSPDGDATLEGYIDLRDPFGTSQLHGYLKFRPSEALVKREPTVELLNNAMTNAKRPDGFLGFQLTGMLQGLANPVPSKEPPVGVVSVSAPPPIGAAPSPSVAPSPTTPIAAPQNVAAPVPQPLAVTPPPAEPEAPKAPAPEPVKPAEDPPAPPAPAPAAE